MYKINKEKCIGCGLCVSVCPEGIELGESGKADIVNQEKADSCELDGVCPYEAIEKENA